MIMKAPISSKYAHSKTQVLLIAQYRLLKLRSVGSENTLELNYLANDRKTLDLNKLKKKTAKDLSFFISSPLSKTRTYSITNYKIKATRYSKYCVLSIIFTLICT